jgi:hypothetical protein
VWPLTGAPDVESQEIGLADKHPAGISTGSTGLCVRRALPCQSGYRRVRALLCVCLCLWHAPARAQCDDDDAF